MMGCGEGWGTCFCVSTGANRTDDYSMAVRSRKDVLELWVEDDAFASYLEGMGERPFKP